METMSWKQTMAKRSVFQRRLATEIYRQPLSWNRRYCWYSCSFLLDIRMQHFMTMIIAIFHNIFTTYLGQTSVVDLFKCSLYKYACPIDWNLLSPFCDQWFFIFSYFSCLVKGLPPFKLDYIKFTCIYRSIYRKCLIVTSFCF